MQCRHEHLTYRKPWGPLFSINTKEVLPPVLWLGNIKHEAFSLFPFWFLLGQDAGLEGAAWSVVLAQSILLSVTWDESMDLSVPLSKREVLGSLWPQEV
jgi:hypothetical protein